MDNLEIKTPSISQNDAEELPICNDEQSNQNSQGQIFDNNKNDVVTTYSQYLEDLKFCQIYNKNIYDIQQTAHPQFTKSKFSKCSNNNSDIDVIYYNKTEEMYSYIGEIKNGLPDGKGVAFYSSQYSKIFN